MLHLGELVYCRLSSGMIRPGVVSGLLDDNRAHVSVFMVPHEDGVNVSCGSLTLRHDLRQGPDSFITLDEFRDLNQQADAKLVEATDSNTGESQPAPSSLPPTTDAQAEGSQPPVQNG